MQLETAVSEGGSAEWCHNTEIVAQGVVVVISREVMRDSPTPTRIQKYGNSR